MLHTLRLKYSTCEPSELPKEGRASDGHGHQFNPFNPLAVPLALANPANDRLNARMQV